jgi:hypothetical protein
MKSLKKIVALVAVAALSISALTGCQKQKPIDNKEIVMTVGDKKVELGMANFFVRYQQSMMEQQMEMYQSYGYVMEWDMEVEEGKTYEESMKEDTLKSLQQLYVLDAHAADYKVALTEDETAKIEEVAKAFAKANKDEVKEKVSAEYAAEYLRLVTISEKMYDAVKASHTPEIKEGEADQKIMYYVKYDTVKQDSSTGQTSELSDDEVKKLKKDAKTLLDGAKANGNLEAYAKEQKLTATKAAFSVDRSELDEKLVKAADKLELNGFTDVIEGESAIYVAQVTSLLDKDATETEKKEIIEERKEEFYKETVEKWVKDTKIKVNDDVWAKISLEGLKISAVEQKKEEDKKEDTTKESTDKAE